MKIVLLHVGSTILVEIVVLAVLVVIQVLQGRDDGVEHCIDSITPKVMGVKGTVGLAAILGCSALLDMLPAGRVAEQGVEDRPYLLVVSRKGRRPGSDDLKDLKVCLEESFVPQKRGASNHFLINGGVLGGFMPKRAVVVIVLSVVAPDVEPDNIRQRDTLDSADAGQDRLDLVKGLSGRILV